LKAEYTVDNMGHLDKIFYEVDGARDHWDRSEGARISFYDTTHGTNEYGMYLGCFTGVDINGKTVLLGVSLLTREDAKSFAWAFKMFRAAMQCQPDVMFTDGDPAMAAALRMALPATKHLLCVFHIGLNLLTHASRLFPKSSELPAKKLFNRAFNDLMTKSGDGQWKGVAESPDEYFERQWDNMLKLVKVSTPCPADLDDPDEDAVYQSCTDELDEEDEAVVREIQAKRGKRKKKPENWLAWEWLKNMKAIRHKWARCFVADILTLNCFSTARSEGWHSALKRYMQGKKYLLVRPDTSFLFSFPLSLTFSLTFSVTFSLTFQLNFSA
jgi:hypothetical protein